MTTGDKLTELRKTAGYSQEYLAEQLDVSRQAVSKWERGESLPSTANLVALAELYGVAVDELVGDRTLDPVQDMRLPPMKGRTLVLLIVLLAAFVVCLVAAIYGEVGGSMARGEMALFLLVSLVFMVAAFGVILGRILRYVREDCLRRGIRPGFWVLASTTAAGLLYYLLRRDELTK